jgi:peptidoglycan/LPS O-acetylase OafA/YrhL
MAAALTAATGTFIACLAASIAFHQYLEKPIGRLLSRRLLKSSAS